MSNNFGQKQNNVICVNPLRTTGSIIPQLTSLKSGTGIGFGRKSGDGIPSGNNGRFILLDIGTLYFSDASE